MIKAVIVKPSKNSKTTLFYGVIRDNGDRDIYVSAYIYDSIFEKAKNARQFVKEVEDKFDVFVEARYGRSKKATKRIWKQCSWYLNKDRYNKKRRNEKEHTNCLWCGKSLEGTRANAKYCSAKCNNAYYIRTIEGRKHYAHRNIRYRSVNEFATNKGKEWSEDEINFIKQNIGKLSYVEMANELHRTYDAVKHRINLIRKQEKEVKEKIETRNKEREKLAKELGITLDEADAYLKY